MDQWSPLQLTIDHKLDLHKEKERIIQQGGRVAPLVDEQGNPCGPLRVWLRTEDVPGLAMSRSLGDSLAASVGVICEPEIRINKLSPLDKCLLLATDGLFEFINNQEIINIIKPFIELNQPQNACNALVQHARNRWIQEEDAIDDITAVVLML